MAIAGESHLIDAVLASRRLAGTLGFEATATSLIAMAVAELAENILKYAGRGEIVLRQVRRENRSGIEVVASDLGPGIDDPEVALHDYHSSSGTLGLGLPSVMRMMDDFQIETHPSTGTRVTVRKWL